MKRIPAFQWEMYSKEGRGRGYNPQTVGDQIFLLINFTVTNAKSSCIGYYTLLCNVSDTKIYCALQTDLRDVTYS